MFGPYQKPVAVVDIGSNAIRLDIRASASPDAQILLTRKTLCRLGKLTQKKRMAKTRMAYALKRLKRYAEIIRNNDVGGVKVIATDALRIAENGPEFAKTIIKETKLPLTVISGEEEARLTALGVLSGLGDPKNVTGLVADLGGGSLELISIKNGKMVEIASLPMGFLKLKSMDKAGEEQIKAVLSPLSWLKDVSTLYAVGGTWRACARLHKAKNGLLTDNVHKYRINGGEITDFFEWLYTEEYHKTPTKKAVEQHRLPDITPSAFIMYHLAQVMGCPDVVFSQSGIREGCFYELMQEIQAA